MFAFQIQFLPRDIFKPLRKSLHLLYLQENEIRFLEKRTFEDFQQLRTLDISRNKLTTIDAKFLHSSKNILHLFMGENLWNCDESSVCLSYGVILDEQKKNRTKLNLHHDLICTTPQKYKDKGMDSLVKAYDCKNINHFSTNPIIIRDDKGNHAHKQKPSTRLLFLLFCMWGCLRYITPVQ